MVNTSSAIALAAAAAVVSGAASTMAAPTNGAPGDLTSLKKFNPYHISPVVSIGSTYLPRSDRREIEDMELEARAHGKARGKWANALIGGGLEFAGNAIASSQGSQRRELEERDDGLGMMFLVSRADGVHVHITDGTGKHSVGASGACAHVERCIAYECIHRDIYT